jgi:hypothetical protein
MRIFLTVATYMLGKQLGIEAAAAEFTRQCTEPNDVVGFGQKPRELLPAARFVRRLVQLGHDVGLYHMASTSLPQLRSRAAWAAYQSFADAWCMVDDDVECTTETLGILFNGLGEHNIVALPCRIRGAGVEQLRVNVRFDGVIEQTIKGVPYRACLRAGTGAMLVSKGALARLMDVHGPLAEDDTLLFLDEEDNELKPALFECIREPCKPWLGEDYSFVERARLAGIQTLAPLQGHSMHDGLGLDLRELTNLRA